MQPKLVPPPTGPYAAQGPSGKAEPARDGRFGFSARTLSGIGPRWWRDEFRLHPRALWEAAFGHFDCYVLSGLYSSITFLTCALLLTLQGKPWLMWLERPSPED